jgi:hypothetical protein
MWQFKTIWVTISMHCLLAISCNNSATVQAPSAASKDTEKENLDSKEDTSKPTDLAKVSGESPEYPLLDFKAKGTTFCKESLATESTVQTKLSEKTLEIKRVTVKVNCYQQAGPFGQGKCNQSEFDQKINSESLGTIVFTRASSEDLSKMKKEDVKPPAYAILATKVITHKGLEYNFSRPLPIFPWPAVKSRYDVIDGEEQVFTADVTGEKNVSISVAISMIDSTEDTVTLQFVSTINGSEERSLYDKFPVPRMAVYTINTKTRDVRAFDSTDWFYDKECPHNGQSSLSYKLCGKEKDKKTETFDCD